MDMELVIGLAILYSLISNADAVSGVRISEKSKLFLNIKFKSNFDSYFVGISECEEYWNNQSRISKGFNDSKEDAAPKEFPFMVKVAQNSNSSKIFSKFKLSCSRRISITVHIIKMAY